MMLLLASPAGLSVIAPVTLTGPLNNFCSADSEGNQRSSVLCTLVPTENVVPVEERMRRTTSSFDQICGAGSAVGAPAPGRGEIAMGSNDCCAGGVLASDWVTA